jgi:hypothetical protein
MLFGESRSANFLPPFVTFLIILVVALVIRKIIQILWIWITTPLFALGAIAVAKGNMRP